MAPLFSYFLPKKAFLSLYIAGIIISSFYLYTDFVFEEMKLASVDSLYLIIIIVLGLYAFFVCNGLYNDFNSIFPVVSQENKNIGKKSILVRNLFLTKKSYKSFIDKVSHQLNSKNEKYFSLGFASILSILLFIEDYYSKRLLISFSEPLMLLRYVPSFIYSTIIFVLLFSIIWLILTMIRALLQLQKESPQLHITKFLHNLEKSMESHQGNFESQRIGMLDLSFRRFQAGLGIIVNFILSFSLKLALVGAIHSIPALIYYIITGDIVIVWYGFEIVIALMSLGVFVFGQYGVWRLWHPSKEKAMFLLQQICAFRTKDFSNNHFPNDVNEDTTLLCKVISDLESLKTVTYSSSFFKLASVNFLTFAPIVLEQLFILSIFS